MKKILSALFLNIILIAVCSAQTKEFFSENGYQLTFINQDVAFSKPVKEKLIKAFFSVYPKLAAAYNPNTLKKVTFVIDTTYKGVAATSNGVVTFSAKYMTGHPGDIDVVTHEVMHIVQNYGNSVGPGWLTEGIADYVRYKYGVDNTGAGWSLPDYKEGQKYNNSYRITARFLLWIETKVKEGTVKKLDEQLRTHTFTENSWKDLTGSTVTELWNKYILNPAI